MWKNLGSLYQSGDWKGEKHVPVIHAPEKVKKRWHHWIKGKYRWRDFPPKYIGALYFMD